MLRPHEPPAVVVERPAGASTLFLTCDHASNRVPEALGDLGVSASERARHIGWDIGALGVARALSARFDAPLVHTNYSRLVTDCNRGCWREDQMPTVSECTPIPGNVGLSDDARRLRQDTFWHPYQDTISAMLRERAAAARPTLFVAIHSFTPVYKGEARPWQVAILSNRDRRIAEVMLHELARDPALCVGDNIPYRLTDDGDYGVPVHAERAGLPHALIEIRQDEITGEAGQLAWAERLAGVLVTAAGAVGLAL